MHKIKGFSTKKEIAGYRWAKKFLQRHRKEIRVKKGKNLSKPRASGANPLVINRWFRKLKQHCKQLDIKDPDQFHNVDETAGQNVPKEEDVVGVTGETSWQLVSDERGELSTILAHICAEGWFAPPMVLHRGAKVGATWNDGCPPGWMVRNSKTGWIDSDRFREFGHSFVMELRRRRKLYDVNGNKRNHLLILDRHSSHVFNLGFIEEMRANNISVLAIPSHTTHLVQPLDSVPFAVFKRAWNKNLIDYIWNTKGAVLNKQNFFKVLLPAFEEAFTKPVIQSGFRKTGIFPVNRKALEDTRMAPSAVTDKFAGMLCEKLD